MKTIVLALFSALLPVAATAQDGGDAAPVVDETWQAAFDGTSFAGWKVPFPEFWTVEEGAIHASMPAEAAWDRKASQGDWTWIETDRRYRHFQIALEARAVKGSFAIVQWGTLKQFLDAGFLGDRWRDVRMTWRGGDVRLWVDGSRIDIAGAARPGDNVREAFLLLSPDSEAWFRNVKIKALDDGGAPGEAAPAAADLLGAGLEGWKADGDWKVESNRLVGQGGREAIWIRTDPRTFARGSISFEYRIDAKTGAVVALVDVSGDVRTSTRVALPAAPRGWQAARIELGERELVLSLDGKEVERAKRARPEGGAFGFALGAGATVEIRRIRYEAGE